jgi:hypothetical protein
MSPTVKKKTISKDTVKKVVKEEVPKEKLMKKKVAKEKVTVTKVDDVNNPPVKKVTKKSTKIASKPSSLKITPEERWKMVAVAAYQKAEKRNFTPGYDLQDWIESENEIDKFING